MCSMYWNLTADVVAPCGHTVKDANLQTHFMGEMGSCVNWYEVGQPVEELGDFTGTLPTDDLFVGDCDQCSEFFEIGAEIERGRVVRLLEPAHVA